MEGILIASSLLLWIIVAFNFLLTLALYRRLKANHNGLNPDRLIKYNTLAIGQPAPDFAVETLHGEPVTLATYAKRMVAFVFISPECGHCRSQIPKLEALQPKAQLSGVELVLVSDMDTASTQAYVNELGISLPVLVAPTQSNSFLGDYQVAGFPFYYIIDADQKVYSAGLPSEQKWDDITQQWGSNRMVIGQPQLA